LCPGRRHSMVCDGAAQGHALGRAFPVSQRVLFALKSVQ